MMLANRTIEYIGASLAHDACGVVERAAQFMRIAYPGRTELHQAMENAYNAMIHAAVLVPYDYRAGGFVTDEPIAPAPALAAE